MNVLEEEDEMMEEEEEEEEGKTMEKIETVWRGSKI